MNSNTILLRPPNGEDPNLASITGKVQDYAIIASQSTDLQITGLRFHATTVLLYDTVRCTISL